MSLLTRSFFIFFKFFNQPHSPVTLSHSRISFMMSCIDMSILHHVGMLYIFAMYKAIISVSIISISPLCSDSSVFNIYILYTKGFLVFRVVVGLN